MAKHSMKFVKSWNSNHKKILTSYLVLMLLGSPSGSKFNNSVKNYWTYFPKSPNWTSNWSVFAGRRGSKVARLSKHRHFVNESRESNLYFFTSWVLHRKTKHFQLKINVNPVFNKSSEWFTMNSISENQTEKPNKSVAIVHKESKFQDSSTGAKMSPCVGAIGQKARQITWECICFDKWQFHWSKNFKKIIWLMYPVVFVIKQLL